MSTWPSIPLPRLSLPHIDLPSPRGRRNRRSWTRDGRAHIEVRTASREGSEGLGRHLIRVLEEIDGVDWAEINGVAGRVIVAFDGEAVDLDDLLGVVEEVEAHHGVSDETFSHDRHGHPGDIENVRRPAFGLAADALGIGVSVAGRILRTARIPVELGSVVGFVEEQPRARQWVEGAVGPFVADTGLALADAFAQALTQGPLGLAVDALHRANQLSAAQARRGCFTEMEADLFPSRELVDPTPLAPPHRPVPLPAVRSRPTPIARPWLHSSAGA